MADIAPAAGITIVPDADDMLPVLDAAPAPAPQDGFPILGAPATAAGLPPGAVLNADRSVTLTLAEPVTLRYRSSATAAPTEEQFGAFTLRRLKGADMRRVTEAQEGDRALMLLAIATDTTYAKMLLIYDRMDAADATALGEVAGFLLGTGRRTGR